jgi:hypothetical protein
MKVLDRIKEALMPKDRETKEATEATIADDGHVEDAGQEPAGAFTPPATQEELDRIIKGRLERVKKKHGDYSDLKLKADEAEARAATAEARLAEVEAERHRAGRIAEAARRHDIPEGILETVADDQVDSYAARVAPIMRGLRARTSLPVILSEGGYVPPTGTGPRDFIREALDGFR